MKGPIIIAIAASAMFAANYGPIAKDIAKPDVFGFFAGFVGVFGIVVTIAEIDK